MRVFILVYMHQFLDCRYVWQIGTNKVEGPLKSCPKHVLPLLVYLKKIALIQVGTHNVIMYTFHMRRRKWIVSLFRYVWSSTEMDATKIIAINMLITPDSRYKLLVMCVDV